MANTSELTFKEVPHNPHNGLGRTRVEIHSEEFGHVAHFFDDANPKPLVSFVPLVWGKHASKLYASHDAKYGEPAYGLCFDEQLDRSAKLGDALKVVAQRLEKVRALDGGAAAEGEANSNLFPHPVAPRTLPKMVP